MVREQDERAHWAESLCTGELPGAVDGVLAHYCWWYLEGGEHGGWRIAFDTVVVAPVLEGIRVARDMEARDDWPTVISAYEREYGRDYKQIEAGALTWQVPIEEDEELIRAAVADVPGGAHLTLREGMVVAAVEGLKTDAHELDALCHTAAAFAGGLKRAARTLRPLSAGDPLPEPRPTPYRELARQGRRPASPGRARRPT